METSSAPSETLDTVVRARVAVSMAFFLLGNGTGIWAVHIPIVQAKLGIDPATLGLALLVMALGAIVSMPLTGALISRTGSRIPTAALMVLYTASIPLIILAPNLQLFFAAAFLFGFLMGSLDVSGNVQASEVETARGRPTMSSFHGFYSVGALVGALIGALVISNGWGDGSGAMTATIVLLAFAAMGAGNLLPSERPIASGPRFALPSRAALGIGVLAFFGFAIEGAITDWGTLFLTGVKQATPTMAAIGYAIFAFAMAAFRLFGDPVVARLGQKATVVGGGLLFAAGVAIALVSPWPMVSAAGFALCGLGGANIVPVLFSEAARLPGESPGAGVAAVATLGYTGFLVTPPVLGFVGHSFGLSAALAVVVLMSLAIAAIGVKRA